MKENEIMKNYPCKDCKIFEDTEKCTRKVKVGDVVYKGCADWRDWFIESWQEIRQVAKEWRGEGK